MNFFENISHEFSAPFSNSVLIFCVILFIILAAPLIFSRFKIPGLIGLIICGAIIGPHGFDLVARNSAVELFSTIGLLYIMFIAGLELNLAEFRKSQGKSIIFGILTFTIPLVMGVPVCYYFLEYNLTTSVLIASMFATHTLISYPIVNRLGIAKNRAVAVAVGGTILTDTAVLLLLAIVAGSNTSGLGASFWAGLGISLTLFVIIVVFVIPRIALWFFRRLEDDKYAHFIFVLLIVFFCAFLAELSGLEPIIGAFAAGLVLNKLIPQASSLMNRIEFVGNALFIPFFLISVGMLINVEVLTHGFTATIIALTLSVVALLSKWLAARITGRVLKYTNTESNLIFGLSSAHAAATLAVILVGYNLELVDDNVLNGTIVLILITCIVSSFVTEQAGKKVVLNTDVEPDPSTGIQRVLVPISNPKTMGRLIDFAMMINSQAARSPIIALSVVKDDDQAQEKLLQARQFLDKAIDHALAADQKIEISATIDRNVVSGIRRVVRERFVSDIVLGWSSEKNIADIIFGRTFDVLIKQTSQTVYIARFNAPLNVHNKIILICPPLAERELGFYKWLQGVLRLASQLQLRIELHGGNGLHDDVSKYIQDNRIPVPVHFKGEIELASVLQDFSLHPGDLVMLVTSREGGVSHNAVLDVLPRKLARRFSQNNFVFIYPETANSNAISNYEQEVTGGILDKGIDIIKNIGHLFK